MKHSAAMAGSLDAVLRRHLIRDDGQEDLCYALWYPGNGANRVTALLQDVVLPEDGDRYVHGNASVAASFLSRVTALAVKKSAGIAFIHSHPAPGWQSMSRDDVETERRQAAPVFAATGLPLVGMTTGNDGAWSARYWEKTAPKTYERRWCETVRVIGRAGLNVTFDDQQLPPPGFRKELTRTVSAWGEPAQQKLARLRVGVVGLGSVGSVVAKSLARMGIQDIKLIDFDRVERHNLDRLLGATSRDARERRLKVDVIGKLLAKSATAASPRIASLPLAVTEEDGFREALDSDVLFSCVDRPWARHVLNLIAYAYLIPVIDGGILIRTKNERLRSASWRTHSVYPGKRCLMCVGQYDPSFVNVERRGDLEDSRYIEGLPIDHPLRRNENVFPFSIHLGASLVLHMLHIVMKPAGVSDLGEQVYHFVDGSIETQRGVQCDAGCFFPTFAALGDRVGFSVTGKDFAATKSRSRAKKRQPRTDK